MIIMVFRSLQEEAVFVNALTITQYHVKDDFRIYDKRYKCMLLEFWEVVRTSFEDKQVIIVDPNYDASELHQEWYIAKSADEIEAFAGIALGNAAKAKITSGIFYPHYRHQQDGDIIQKEGERQERIKRVKKIKTDKCSCCMEQIPEIMFDCGHEMYCEDCEKKITVKKCSLCRKETKTIFFSGDNEEK